MPRTRDEIVDWLEELVSLDDVDVLLADGFDDAFMGVAPTPLGHMVAVYDIDRCIELLMEEGMSHEEADEYFQFNVAGAYVGEQTPLFLKTMSRDSAKPAVFQGQA